MQFISVTKNYYDISFAFSIGCLCGLKKEEIATFLFKNNYTIYIFIVFLAFVCGVQGWIFKFLSNNNKSFC